MPVFAGSFKIVFNSIKSVILNQGQFCPPKDIWQYLETFWVVMPGVAEKGQCI